jgi:hypothetical protein
MTAALAEPTHTSSTTNTKPGTARAEASRANGRLSCGPISPEGKERSRRNGCKEGFTGAGVVLPPAADAEVKRREAEFADDIRPKNAVERELVHQMALGAWRSHELGVRIMRHDAAFNAARFANWEQDEQLAAIEIGRRLGDDPEMVVAQLQRTSAGCDWLTGRWNLLDNALSTGEEGEPGCAWTDADLALALNLLGRSEELRHLDGWAGRLESLYELAALGSDESVAELRQIITEEVAKLESRRKEVWEEIETPQLQAWSVGFDIDLGPEGTRLRRYEAAADRLFRSAWTKLERLRAESGESLIPRSGRTVASAPDQAVRVQTDHPAVSRPAPLRSVPGIAQWSSLLADPVSDVLNFRVGGPLPSEINPVPPCQDKTNPAPSRSATGGRGAKLETNAENAGSGLL